MKLELAILAGAESKAFLVEFKKLLDRAEGLVSKPGKKAKAAKDEEAEEEEEEEEEELPEEEEAEEEEELPEEEEAEEEEAEEEEEETKSTKKKKTTKAPKITEKELNAACKAKVQSIIKAGTPGPEARKQVLKLMKKKFGVTSVAEVEPDQYAAFLKVFK